jgi:hypothetical protein
MFDGGGQQPMTGIFDFSTASDLRDKLRRDLERLTSEPLNSDAAFNFFVTAEHMLDWSYPGQKNRQDKLKKCSVYLLICSHLANGAKHFEASRHNSVSSTGTTGGYLAASYFSPRYSSNAYFGAGRRLVVRLGGQASSQLGQAIGVVELAKKVMEYWDQHSLV